MACATRVHCVPGLRTRAIAEAALTARPQMGKADASAMKAWAWLCHLHLTEGRNVSTPDGTRAMGTGIQTRVGTVHVTLDILDKIATALLQMTAGTEL